MYRYVPVDWMCEALIQTNQFIDRDGQIADPISKTVVRAGPKTVEELFLMLLIQEERPQVQ
jgi:hypothetical protein